VLKVTIVEDDLVMGQYLSDKVRLTSGLRLLELFTTPGNFIASFQLGYRSELYLLDCLWRGDIGRNYGYILSELILKHQPDALIIIVSQVDPKALMDGLKGLPIQAAIDKNNGVNTVEDALRAIALGFRAVSGGADVIDLATSKAIHGKNIKDPNTQYDGLEVVGLGLSLQEKVTFLSLLTHWHIGDIAIQLNLSRSTITKHLHSISEKLDCNSVGDVIYPIWARVIELGIWTPSMSEMDGTYIRTQYQLLSKEQKFILSALALGESVSTIAAEMKVSQPRASLMVRELRVCFEVTNRADLWNVEYLRKR
jgi:DNA-binding NarL/FixJ family response regulator